MPDQFQEWWSPDRSLPQKSASPCCTVRAENPAPAPFSAMPRTYKETEPVAARRPAKQPLKDSCTPARQKFMSTRRATHRHAPIARHTACIFRDECCRASGACTNPGRRQTECAPNRQATPNRSRQSKSSAETQTARRSRQRQRGPPYASPPARFPATR